MQDGRGIYVCERGPSFWRASKEEENLQKKIDTLEEVEGGGGGFTEGVDTLEEVGGGGESTGRKIMLVGFCFFGASCGTFESSSFESDSDGFRTISVRGGGTSLSDEI